MISALNRPHELKLHVKAALTNGLSREEIREVLLQVAVYCGVPAGIDSVRIAREAFAEIDAAKRGMTMSQGQHSAGTDGARLLPHPEHRRPGDDPRARCMPTPEWRPMVEGMPGAGVHGPRDYIVDKFLGAGARHVRAGRSEERRWIASRPRATCVMCETRGSGTLLDGRKYNNRYAWSIDVRDGKIFVIREYMDSHYVATLFGAG